MADVRCPMCGKPNPAELEECQFCGARIKPLLASTPVDSKPIKAGEQPIQRDTSEFEKVKSADEGPIHAGEAPTKKSTSELEQALPSWLRTLRQDKEPAGDEATPPAQDMPIGSGPTSAPEASDEKISDWLSGLGKAASEDEDEAPDWLTGLRGGKIAEPTSRSETIPTHISGGTDWFTRLGSDSEQPPAAAGESQPAQAEKSPAAPAAPQSSEELPDWFSELSAGPPESPSLQDEKEESAPRGDETPASAGKMPDWLDLLKDKTDEPESAPGSEARETTGGEFTPDWLSSFGAGTAATEAASSQDTPDWLSNFEPRSDSAATAAESESETPVAGTVPDWLSNLEPKPGAGAPATEPESEIAVPGAVPEWLSQLQADVNAAAGAEKQPEEEFESTSEEPPQKSMDAPPAPEWLAGIESATPATSGSTPALIVSGEGEASDDGKAAFSLEVPDWLSKLKPEEGARKAVASEEEAAQENLEVAELPSWVQAMRPVESVVADTKTTPLEEGQTTAEVSGPLAGLQGVLPADPGLGALRKPPAYSTKLQVTEGQRRYATHFEKLIAGEMEPKLAQRARMKPSQLWRLLTASVLILMVSLPLLLTGAQIAPNVEIDPTDSAKTIALMDRITENDPVLVVFDYDPALSGELEAASAPVVARVLGHGAKLAVLSTNPTGPALAEQFLTSPALAKQLPEDTQASYLQGEKPYVNLGYLAGGASGVLYFASSPQQAAGKPGDWETFAGLQNVQAPTEFKLSDFKAILILTDNADTSRNWIEQARSEIDNGTPEFSDDTPLLMVISAQAEPMIRPYFDSGQIQGLVTGLVGAKVYEQYAGSQGGLGQRYWDSFSIGTFTAILLIIGGAIWGIVTGRRTSDGKPGGGASS